MKARRALALAVALVLAVVVAACGGDATSSGPDAEPAGSGGARGAPIVAEPANRGKRLTIGSKNFAEQYVLAEIYAQALTAAGFTVAKRLDLGSEQVAFDALKAGRIDAYPEYTGTALTAFYGVRTEAVPRVPDEAFDALRSDLKADAITPMPQTPFQNTYVVTSTRATAARLGRPVTLTELAGRVGGDATLSGFPECRPRADCLVGLRSVYRWSPRFIPSEGQYKDLDDGRAQFTMGFGTDGALALDKYTTYEDDKQLFPPYYVTLLTRDRAAEALGPAGRAVIERVQAPLSEEVMRELNSRVVLDGEPPAKVAAAYLQQAGFTG